jgi:hypothetical protein
MVSKPPSMTNLLEYDVKKESARSSILHRVVPRPIRKVVINLNMASTVQFLVC